MMTQQIILWTPRVLGILFAGFCYLFVLEGLSSEFSWKDSLFHFLQGSIMLVLLLVGWRWHLLGALGYAALAAWVFIGWRHAFFTVTLGTLLLVTAGCLVASRQAG